MEELKLICKNLERQGLNVLWQKLPMAQFYPEGYVVKVVVPEMVPLSQFHGASWLGSTRLQNSEMKGMNPYPHPFA
jgi:hypothetical protein